MSRPVGSASSNPHVAAEKTTPFSPVRSGEVEPTGLAQIKDPELRAAVMCAHRGWAKRYRPDLLREWNG